MEHEDLVISDMPEDCRLNALAAANNGFLVSSTNKGNELFFEGAVSILSYKTYVRVY